VAAHMVWQLPERPPLRPSSGGASCMVKELLSRVMCALLRSTTMPPCETPASASISENVLIVTDRLPGIR
jgi:hypothetical protein